MGCAFRKPETTNNNEPNFFRVVNIDQEGNDYLPGKIEVTSEYLILHQGKKQSIQWPIRTLRRYGFEYNIFSFEAGRRCPTGEGIFAFRCPQAEQLFRLLQANIQRSCSTSNVQYGDATQNNYLEPRPVPVRGGRLESVGSSSSCPHTPSSPAQTSSSVFFDDKEMKPRNDSSDKKTYSLVTIPKNSANSSPLYINVGADDTENPSGSQTQYLNFAENSARHYTSSLDFNSPTDDDPDELSPRNNLQYVTLALGNKTSSPVTKTPTQESKPSVGYTTIDFQRTWALFQSTKPNIENDIGCRRRTRHNSNLFGVHR